MNIQLTFKNIDDSEKGPIEHLLRAQIEDLSEYLQKDLTDEDSGFAKCTVESFDKHTVYHVSVHITIKAGHAKSYHAEEKKHKYDEAINLVRGKLQQQILSDKK